MRDGIEHLISNFFYTCFGYFVGVIVLVSFQSEILIFDWWDLRTDFSDFTWDGSNKPHLFSSSERTSWPYHSFLVQKVPCNNGFPAHFHTSAAASPLNLGLVSLTIGLPPTCHCLKWRCSQTWSPTTSLLAPVLKKVVGKPLWPCWWRCQHGRRGMTFLRFERLSFFEKRELFRFFLAKRENSSVSQVFFWTGRVFHGFPLRIQWQPATSWKGWSFVKVWHQVRPDLRSFGPCISRETRKRDFSRWQLVDRT